MRNRLGSLAAAFVWTTFGAMVALCLLLVRRHGVDCPIWDEWAWFPNAVGKAPVTLGWLWSPHGEHRVPIARLLYAFLMRVFRGDVRSVMYFDVLLLALETLILVLALRRARGRLLWTDALVPLAVLSPGQYENLLWAFQTCMLEWAILFGTLLAIVIRLGSGLSTAGWVALGVALVLLPLCGGPGFLVAAPLAVWLFAEACRRRAPDERPERARRIVKAAVASAAVLLVGLYLWHLPSTPAMHRVDWRAAFDSGRAFLSTAFLPDAASSSRSGWSSALDVWKPWGDLGLGLLAATLLVLAWAWIRHPESRRAVAGLGVVSVAFLCLVAGVGAGRSAFGPANAAPSRYSTLATPLLLLGHVTFSLHGPRGLRKLVPGVLVVVLALLLASPNPILPGVSGTLDRARAYGARRAADYRQFEQDVLRGASLEELDAHHGFTIAGVNNVTPGRVFQLMQRHGIGPFRSHDRPLVHEDFKTLRMVPVATNVVGTVNMTWEREANQGRGLNGDPYLTLDLGPPRRVIGVRIEFRARNLLDEAVFMQVAWYASNPAHPGGDYSNRSIALRRLPPDPGHRAVTIWIYDTIDRLRIDPDVQRCEFTLSGLTLILPAADAGAAGTSR